MSMNILKVMALSAVAGLLALVGCQSDIHSVSSPEERARRAQAAAARAEKARLAAHKTLCEMAVTNALSEIRECYSEGMKYQNPFREEMKPLFNGIRMLEEKKAMMALKRELKRRMRRGRNHDRESDWLARWASPRLALTEADAQAGEALLSEFGAKYLPNAYANYEKRREALAVLQQVFNEEFPQPWTIKETNPKWNSFNKVLERFVQARTETFLCHDELCHYWLLWRLGVLSVGDLAAADAKRLSVPLLPENVTRTESEFVSLKPLEGKIADFAAKYAPASGGLYQKMAREFKEIDALLAEVGKQRRQMDDVRHSRALTAAVAKRNELARELNALSLQLQTWHMDHRTAEKSADDVARCDADMAKKLKPFLDALPGYVKERTLGPVIAASELVAIPGKGYRMQRTEVTPLQWLLVMGDNPSSFQWLLVMGVTPSIFQGLNRPVENVSWDDCQAFIRRASEMDGRHYRLPTEAEWDYACRAGSTGDWGKRTNGECGPLDVMGWYDGNSDREIHPVAQKEPNAWGLYDMHGNVWEWCQDLCWSGYSTRVRRGGSSGSLDKRCSASLRGSSTPVDWYDYVGFRLVAPLD